MDLNFEHKRIVIFLGAALIILLIVVQIYRESGYDFTITETDNKAITFYLGGNNNYYLYGIDSVSINYDGKIKSLKEILNDEVIAFDDLIKGFKKHNDKTSAFYQGEDINIIVCYNNDASDDIYIGSKNMEYNKGFCGEK